MIRAALLGVLMLACALAAAAPMASADGDPGSDVLVYQRLYVPADVGATVAQQVALGNELAAAQRGGSPIRVAVIARPADLGAVTALWHRPQAYAKFLGIELSLAYKQRLLVVMPNGFGINWPGHSTAAARRALAGVRVPAGTGGLALAAGRAVQALAAQSGVRLPASAPGKGAPAAATSTATATASAPGHGTDTAIAAIAAGLILAAGLGYGAVVVRRRRPRVDRRLLAAGGGGLVLAVAIAGAVVAVNGLASNSDAHSLGTNPELDPGTALSRAAPGFTLSDQFGRSVSLSSYRGKVVVLAFTDSECATICPLTTTAMLDAKRMLGAAGSRVQLLGIDANPKATSLQDVASYSQLHGMTRDWHFLTGSLPALHRVWHAYGIQADIERGLIAHTPALYLIDPSGHLRRLYVTQQSYAAVGQFGQLLADEASQLLPSHPAVHSNLTYRAVPGIAPSRRVSVPRASGGTVTLGPSPTAHLYMFFATWSQGFTGLAAHLQALNGYRAAASRSGLPPVTAVDEGSVEPTPATLPAFLRGLPHRLAYPVAVDETGRLADGYGVQGQPWFVLVSPSGHVMWYDQAYSGAWPSNAALIRQVRAALAKTPRTSAPAVTEPLPGTPAPLRALRAQADRLIGGDAALKARIRTLRGYPIVVNAWASDCGPCRAEFSLFASADRRYGRSTAFLGADTDDSAPDARAFLRQHPVGYPSYAGNEHQIGALTKGGLEGLPTTIYLNRSGKVVDVHTGQYPAQGALDGDIQTYAR
jgi:cytochrome oxidase Cu insertion factor (SCO1/SenC/PrrC family)/thiol-disulfide isomerase/thioredoxin